MPDRCYARARVPKLEAAVWIQASPARVWEVAQDYGRRGEWDSRISGATWIGDTPLGVGARVRYRFRGGLGTRFWMEAVYVVFEPGRRSGVRFDRVSWASPFRTAGGAWELTPDRDGTRFTTRFSYELRWGWWGRFLDRAFVRAAAQRETTESLQRLKALLERSGGPRAE
jgi:uncharacterized protein YndB with AHSA1/START domain